MGYRLRWKYDSTNRIGDHICYISDLTKLRTHFPGWHIEYDLPRILSEMIDRRLKAGKVAELKTA